MCVTLGADSADESAVFTSPGCLETVSHPPQVSQRAPAGVSLAPP